MNAAIRSGRPGDAAAVAACIDQVARERRYLAVVEGFTAEETERFLARLVDAGGVHLVAEWNDEIVATCDIAPIAMEGMRHVGRLGIAVLATWRGRGIGRRLLREAVDRAFASGLARVELEVFASNTAAIRLYESEGFRLEGRRRCARRLDGVEDDLLIYGLLADEPRPPASS